nr:hypothetical protein [Tanacetum cinerariifolium]
IEILKASPGDGIHIVRNPIASFEAFVDADWTKCVVARRYVIRFGGNDESKKMQKYILKQQFKSFSVSNSKGLHKGYDRFQSLLSQIETHGAGVSTKDANQKFLRSLPSSWSEVSLIMRTKPGVDTLSFDDLYNNLKVFESDVKGSSGSSSSTQNVAFVSSDSTSNTNEVNTTYDVSTSSDHNSQREGSFHTLMTSCTLSLLINPVVAMISMRLKKFYKKTGRKLNFDAKEPVGFDKTKVECFNYHNTVHFAREIRSNGNQESRRRDAGNTGHKARDNRRRPAKHDEPKAMVTIDGKGVDWTGHDEDDIEDNALMAFNSSNSGLDTKMTAKDKSGLGYGTQIHEGVLSYENEVFESVFDSRPCDVKDSHVNDKFAQVERMHAVPPPMIGIYMPPKSNFGIDESKFKYGCSDAPIIEEYNLDSDDEYMFKATMEQEIPSCASINIVKFPVKAARQNFFSQAASTSTVRKVNTARQTMNAIRPRDNLFKSHAPIRRPFSRTTALKAHFTNHKVNNAGDKTLRAIGKLLLRPQQVVIGDLKDITETKFPVKAARQNFFSQAASTSTVRKVNTARQTMNAIRPRDNLFKSHAPIRRPFSRTTALKAHFTNHKVNNAGDKTLRAIGKLLLRPQQDNPHQSLKGKDIIDSGCSRYMTGNKAYLVEYKDFNGGLVAFGGSKGQITSKGKGPTWLFDLDYLIDSMNYQPVTTKNKANKTAGPKEANNSASKNGDKNLNEDVGSKKNKEPVDQKDQAFLEEIKKLKRQEKEANDAAGTLRKTTPVNTAGTTVTTASPSRNVSAAGPSNPNLLTYANQDDSQIPSLKDIYEVPNVGIFTSASYDDEGAVVDFINLEYTVNVSLISQSRIHSIHPTTQILRDPNSAVHTRSKVNKSSGAHALIEPKKISQALKDESWVDAMQEELLQFKTQNKKDEKGVVVRNKARLVAQEHRQEEGIDYDEVFTPVARIEAIMIFFAFASYTGFIVYQMDVKSAFLYGKIDEEKDQKDIMLMSSMGELTFFLRLQVKQREYGIFISQDKYVAEILKKFNFMSVKTASTLIETKKPLVKDAEAADVDVLLYRSMIGSLMYLTASRHDIMYAVCGCSRFQVTPKTSHLQAVKRIFRHHFIKDAYEKKLIQVLKIHTDENVADLLTKAFDVSRKVYELGFGLEEDEKDLQFGFLGTELEGNYVLSIMEFWMCLGLWDRRRAMTPAYDRGTDIAKITRKEPKSRQK